MFLVVQDPFDAIDGTRPVIIKTRLDMGFSSKGIRPVLCFIVSNGHP